MILVLKLKNGEDIGQIKRYINEIIKKDKIIGIEIYNNIDEKYSEILSQEIKILKDLKKINLSECFLTQDSDSISKNLKIILKELIDKPL